MFPTFFKNKMKEVRAFLKIMRGKVARDDQVRKEGVDDALHAMEEEKRVYRSERKEAEANVDSDVPVRKSRDEGLNRDISGY